MVINLEDFESPCLSNQFLPPYPIIHPETSHLCYQRRRNGPFSSSLCVASSTWYLSRKWYGRKVERTYSKMHPGSKKPRLGSQQDPATDHQDRTTMGCTYVTTKGKGAKIGAGSFRDAFLEHNHPQWQNKFACPPETLSETGTSL